MTEPPAELGASSAKDRIDEPMVNTPHGLMRRLGQSAIELLDPETGWVTRLKSTPPLRRLFAECAEVDAEVDRHTG